MRDVEAAINEVVTSMTNEYPQVLGERLRVRLHPSDYATLIRQVSLDRTAVSQPLGVDELKMNTPTGVVTIETDPVYVKGVVSLMAPDVMNPLGVAPLSDNLVMYECCNECGVREAVSDQPGGEKLTQCKHTLAVSGCDAWLCEDCVEQHDERQHVQVALRAAQRKKEREEHVAKAKAGTLTDVDYATRMRQKRAAKKAWVTRRANDADDVARKMSDDVSRKHEENVFNEMFDPARGTYEGNAFLRLGAIFARTEDDTTVRTATIAAMYWLGAEKRYGEVAAWPAFSTPIREHIIEEIRRGSVLGEPGEDVPRAVARLEDLNA